MKARLLVATSAAALSLAGMASAQSNELTLCWAAWDPANALVELSKDFEAQSGIKMNFEFVPWPNFADRMLNELNSGGQLCDLLIGDSQWIGGSAENGHYVKLNDFFDKEGISMDDFAPATVYAYSTWPKGTPNYYALPAMGDANGWFYRKDWFARPEIQAEFKEKYGRDLAEPKTQKELLEIAQFFQGREIDGQTVYGASIFTERGSEGITMGATGDSLYVASGSAVDIVLSLAGKQPKRLASFAPGTVFGEMAMLGGHPRSADAILLGPGTVWELSRETLGTLEQDHPAIAQTILRNIGKSLADRLRLTTTELRLALEG